MGLGDFRAVAIGDRGQFDVRELGEGSDHLAGVPLESNHGDANGGWETDGGGERASPQLTPGKVSHDRIIPYQPAADPAGRSRTQSGGRDRTRAVPRRVAEVRARERPIHLRSGPNSDSRFSVDCVLRSRSPGARANARFGAVLPQSVRHPPRVGPVLLAFADYEPSNGWKRNC